jgi:Mn-dependent DtxR family transcriptional regulator
MTAKINKEVAFQINPTEVLTRLIEKYGLKESTEEFLEKIEKGEVTIGEKIAEVVSKVIHGEILPENLSIILKENLAISKETAEKLAEDIKKEIIDRTEEIPTEETKLSEKKEILPEKPLEKIPKEPLKKDIYREPIE